MSQALKGEWIKGVAHWREGETACISVAFTWRLPEARRVAEYYRSLGIKRVRVGGPGVFTQRKYVADFAEIGGEIPDALARHNPAATRASYGCPVGCWFCLPPDDLIVTADGLKRVADIRVGEMVLTHLGRYRPVTKTMSQPYSGPLKELNSGALSQLFKTHLTPEHPVYTRRVAMPSGGARLREFAWTNASDIVPERSRYAREVFTYPHTLETSMHEGNVAPGLPAITLCSDFMTLLGWYVAEGYVTSAPNRGAYRVTFCLGFSETEQEYGEEIVLAAAQVGLKAKSRLTKIGYRVMIHNVDFVRWLVAEFGTGASEKKLPLWLRLLPVEHITPFVDAWVKGDGWGHVKRGANTWKVTTISPHLATGLREIAMKCGFPATINKHHQNDEIQGRKVAVKDAYTVIFHERRDNPTSLTFDTQYSYSRVQESGEDYYSGNVYNLEVAEDNSYCTPAFAVHNCIVPKMDGKTFRLLPDFPVRPILCDDNLSALPADYQDHVVARYLAAGVPLLDANSGFEPATFDDEVFARWRPILKGPWRFGFDEATEGENVARAFRILKDVSPRLKQVYTMIGHEPFDVCMDRIQRVIASGGEPYAQPFMKLNALKKEPAIRHDWTAARLRHVQRWVNRRIWRKHPFSEYDASVKTNPHGPVRPSPLFDEAA